PRRERRPPPGERHKRRWVHISQKQHPPSVQYAANPLHILRSRQSILPNEPQPIKLAMLPFRHRHAVSLRRVDKNRIGAVRRWTNNLERGRQLALPKLAAVHLGEPLLNSFKDVICHRGIPHVSTRSCRAAG